MDDRPLIFRTDSVEKRKRFQVENLFNVRCLVIGDPPNSYRKMLENCNQQAQTTSCEVQLAVPGGDKYSMEILDASTKLINQGNSNLAASALQANLIMAFVPVDDLEEESEEMDEIRTLYATNAELSTKPLLLIGYKRISIGDSEPAQFAMLGRFKKEMGAKSCIDCPTINRVVIRHTFALALLIARSYLEQLYELSQICYVDEKDEQASDDLSAEEVQPKSTKRGLKKSRILKTGFLRLTKLICNLIPHKNKV